MTKRLQWTSGNQLAEWDDEFEPISSYHSKTSIVLSCFIMRYPKISQDIPGALCTLLAPGASPHRCFGCRGQHHCSHRQGLRHRLCGHFPSVEPCQTGKTIGTFFPYIYIFIYIYMYRYIKYRTYWNSRKNMREQKNTKEMPKRSTDLMKWTNGIEHSEMVLGHVSS